MSFGILIGVALGVLAALGLLLLPAIVVAAAARLFAGREARQTRKSYLEPVASFRAAPASSIGGRNVS